MCKQNIEVGPSKFKEKSSKNRQNGSTIILEQGMFGHVAQSMYRPVKFTRAARLE